MATETVDKTLAEMTTKELIGELGHEIDRLKELLLPPVPKSRAERAAELGLRVVEDGDG